MKTNIRSVLTLLAFLCLPAAGPQAQAVVPPPDGGYPNFTTAEGQNALFSLTSGAANTAVGWFSLFSDTETVADLAAQLQKVTAQVQMDSSSAQVAVIDR